MREVNGTRAGGSGERKVLAPPASVSVVIPTYNRAQVVAEAVESALAQRVPPLEVIVVDDGSSDGTHERLTSFGDRIVYIHQENQGVSAARNTGVRAARGELIAFLDSDDIWHPRKLEIQLHYLQQHPETALVGAVTFYDSSRRWPALPDTSALPAQPVVLETIIFQSPFATSTVVVRKHCFDAVGYFDTGLRNAEDRDLYIRIASRYPIIKLGAVLGWGRTDGEHLSMGSVAGEKSTRKMIVRVFDQVDAFRGRFLLKQRALSYAAFEASYNHLAKGKHLWALHRIVRSLLLWPLPYPRKTTTALARVKRLFRILVALCGRK
jgi:glycosyltransferase involved in cell wall biosynthesis